LDSAPALLAYPVHGAADPSVYAESIDAAEELQQRKLQAMAEHRTQMALSGRRMRRLAQDPERYMRIGGEAGDARLPWRPPMGLRRWLRLLVATPAGARDWPWPEAPWVRDDALRLDELGPGPVFAKLHLDWPSPWIFDHWGWWEATTTPVSSRQGG
jgi:hypothetical protein